MTEPDKSCSAATTDLLKMLELHVDGVRHYLHLQIGKPLSKDLISAPEVALDNLYREVSAAIRSDGVAQAEQEPVGHQFRQRSGVGKGPQSSAPWCDWCFIERETYEKYQREPNKLVQVRPVYAAPVQSSSAGTAEPSLTPTQFVDDIISACDPSNWDSELNKGARYRGLHDAYTAILEIADEYQQAMYDWTRLHTQPQNALTSPEGEQ